MTDFLRTPPPDPRDPAVIAAWDEVSLWSSRFGALLLEHLELRRGIRALDVACGTGFPVFELAQRHGRSSSFVALDSFRAVLPRAESKRHVYGLPNVALLAADAAHLPFGAARFHLVTSHLGINNFADPAAALVECARVLAPGGRLVLTTNVIGHMREFYDVFRQVFIDLTMERHLAALAANEAHRGSLGSWSAALASAGLRVTRTFEDKFTMRFIDADAMFGHALVRGGFLPAWRAAVGPDDEDTVFAETVRRLDERAAREGALTMTVPMLYLEATRDA